jgi:fluoroacetyl-CoA thioesterase
VDQRLITDFGHQNRDETDVIMTKIREMSRARGVDCRTKTGKGGGFTPGGKWEVGPAGRMARSRVGGMGVAPGQRASVSAVVADADTAISAGSGDVPVLATPRLLALAEAAAVAAIAPHLAPGMTSVGTSVSLEHRRASPVGAEVVVEAELTEVDGRRLMFSFIAREGGQDDEDLVVGAGTVERVLVDRAAFVARAASHPR